MRYFLALIAGVLAAGAIVVIGLQVRANTNRPTRTIVHNRTVITTPIVSSPVTPLPRDSGPKNNPPRTVRSPSGAGQSGVVRGSSGSRTPAQSPTRSQGRSPVRTHPTPRRHAKRPTSPQKPSSGSPSPSPAPQPSKPVTITTPVPVQVCVDKLLGVNC